MEITLKIQNVDENLIKAIRSVINLHPQATLKVKKRKKLTLNGYTKEFEAKILQD